MMQENIRLNKYISDAGICSRRMADVLIAEGRVTVNGSPAQPGMRVMDSTQVCVDGKRIKRQEQLVVLAYNKPKGVVCTADKAEPENVYRYLDYPTQLKYIGRLDRQSEGLLLFTNQGSFADRVSRAGNYHEKEYIVKVNRPLTEAFLCHMGRGMDIEIDGKTYQTRPCPVTPVSRYKFRIILTQGFNRQIRRMCRTEGYHVVALKRVRVMNVELGDLPVGTYRLLSGTELTELKKQLNYQS